MVLSWREALKSDGGLETRVAESLKNVILRKKTSGIAVVLIDCLGKVNSLSAEVTDELEQVLVELEEDASVKAVVFLSGKADTFVVGADLFEIVKLTDIEKARTLSSRGQALLNRLVALGKPTVVGINGACLGGGLELALACQKRIVSSDEHTVLGLPEVKLGIIPGMGGTQRLPRRVGLRAALDLILSGEPVSASRALEIGLVDEIVNADHLIARCEQSAVELLESGCVIAQPSAFDMNNVKQQKILATAERSVRIRTKGQHPASTRVIDVIKHGLACGIDSGLALEAQVFAELAVTDIAKNQIALFFNTEFARQTARVMSVKLQTRPVQTIGVIGSGVMGIAVAQLAVLAGYKVLFRPTNRNPADNPVEHLLMSLSRAQHKAKLSDQQFCELRARVEPISDELPLSQADLVIEAIYEDEQMKAALFERLEQIIRPDCTVTTNTSSLSISRLATYWKNSGRFLGTHFFLPAERMPLVEVISHGQTKRDSLATAAAVISQLGKIPVVVNDGPGFLVNRLLCTYIVEAARLAASGVPLNWIDEAAVNFGMAMGPMTVIDEVGLDVAFKVADALYHGLGERFAPPAVMSKTRALGLTGKKTGVGIYMWDDKGRRLHMNPRLTSEVGLVVADGKVAPEKAQWIVERIILPMIDEASRCLEDKIVRKPREIDLAMVLGTGFPAFRGGPLRYADSLGITAVRSTLEKIYDQDGSRRSVAGLFAVMENEGRRFYSRSSEPG